MKKLLVGRKKKIFIGFALVVPLMFGFSYLLVPAYEKICLGLGINGRLMKDPVVYEAGKIPVDPTRTLHIRFLADKKSDVPFDFYPLQKEISVHPGELVEATFYAKNNSAKTVTTRVLVNSLPASAVKNMHEVIHCFCIGTHTLAPGEETELPVAFYVDTGIPASIEKMMVSYTLFNATRYT